MVRFEVFVISRGGGRTPQTLSPARGPAVTFGKEFGADEEGTFATKSQADAFIAAKRNEFTTRDNPVGVRQVPTTEQAAAFERTEGGEQITGPAPKGKRTTRTPEEETRIKAKSIKLAGINKQLREGKITTAEAQRLRLGQETISKEQLQKEKTTERRRRIIETTAKIERARPSRPFQLSTAGKGLVDIGQIPRREIGVVTKVSPPTSLVGRIEAKRQRLSFEAEFRTRDQPFKRQVLKFGAAGLTALAIPVSLVTQPKEFITGTLRLGKQIITQPSATGLEFGRVLRQQPEVVVGAIAGTALTGKGLQKVIQLPIIPKPAKGIIEIPTPKGTAEIKVFGIAAGTRALPLVTRTPRGLKLGRVDISPELTQLKPGADIKIGGPLETALIKRGLEKAPGTTKVGLEAIAPARRILIKTRRTRAKAIGLPTQTERLGPKATKIVLGIAKEEQAVVFGSFARKAQDPAGRLPRDIDIRVDKATGPDIQRITETTLGRLRRGGEVVRLRGDTPGVIEVKRGKVFEKAVEFKGKEPLIEGEKVPEQILGLQKVGKPIKVADQQFTSLSEELRGVTQGVIRVKKTPEGRLTIGPPPKRVKDIGSLLQTGKTLAGARLVRSKLLEKDIFKLEELFGRKKTISPPETLVRLADFGPSRRPRVGGGRIAVSPVSPVSKVSPRAGISPVSPRPSPRPSPSISISPRISPSVSPVRSVSPSISPSPRPSISPVISPSPSKSPIGKSISPFPSPSPRPSPSISISPRPSLSISPSISPGPSISPTLPISPGFFLPLPRRRILRPIIPKPRKERKRRFRGTPSLSVVLSGVGTQLTRGQISGKETVNPLLIRQIGRRIR